MLNNKVLIYLSGKNSRDIEFIVETNFTKKQIEEAYDTGTKIVGFDFCNTFCADYEESSIDHVSVKKLVELGLEDFVLANDEEDYEFENGYSLDENSFLDIFLFICKLGNPEFQFKMMKDKYQMESIDIGGYGIVER